MALAATSFAGSPGLIISGDQDNDLLKILQECGFNFSRMETPSLAIAQANDGDAVIILADGYPETPTPVDAALFAAAKAKNLRIYVEYPASLPGLAVGERVTPRYDRAVIQSEFFGTDLAPLRILAIHGLTYLPVNTANAHMVSAQVAGFDLGKTTKIARLGVSALQSNRLGIYLPSRVEFSVSTDGEAFTSVAEVKPLRQPETTGVARELMLSNLLDGVEARHIRVRTVNLGVIPAGLHAAGQPAWMFLDEIVVNPRNDR